MLKAVIFDMDGVVIDSHPAHRKAWRVFLETVGRSATDQELDFVLDGRKRSEILRHFLGDLSEEEIRRHGIQKDEILNRTNLVVRTIPGATQLLDRLRSAGIATALATSASASRAHSTLQRLHLTGKFDALVSGNDVVAGKPDPAIYRLACERLRIEPAHSAAIEDAASGVRSATAAGLACIALAGQQSAEALSDAGAALVVSELSSLTLRQIESLLLRRSKHPARSALAAGSAD